MPKLSSTNATIHASQYLIIAIQNPATEIPLVTLGNSLKDLLISLEEIFVKATPPAVSLRVPIRGAY